MYSLVDMANWNDAFLHLWTSFSKWKNFLLKNHWRHHISSQNRNKLYYDHFQIWRLCHTTCSFCDKNFQISPRFGYSFRWIMTV